MYSLWVYYNGYSSEQDSKIRLIVGFDNSGSGSDFKERDMDFKFKSEDEAIKIGERLIELGLITRYKIFDSNS